VRRICNDCIISYKPDASITSAVNRQLSDLSLDVKFKLPAQLYKGAGCLACGDSGYKGRLGIFEILNVTEEIRKLIVNPAFTLGKLRAAARKGGMVTMFEDGLKKVERGSTTIDEILRVIRE
jgi:type II secretory ATPase GspE/PulE/Tfp pilus assembly ATPase PilB-like protein